ncbi:ATP-grasp domain-containing protein [Anoxybacillus ayderensis]|uniref:ATP-grasp domain-containing protein n=1 Tax=Anoxybacillus ayderensis TaxID=265546 RepID=UPI002E1DF97D|nr:ATP-grasp domain-containing protein [Anoxybacillus ayderensis]
MRKHIAIIEATTSGAGLEVIRSAYNNGIDVSFFTSDPTRYTKFNTDHVLQKINRVVICDTKNEAMLENELSKLNTISPLGGILTLTDGCIEVVSKVSHKLGYTFMNPKAVSIARNKEQTRKHCKKYGINTPKFRVVDCVESAKQLLEEWGGSIILKNSKGTGSSSVQLCTSNDELEVAFHEIHKEASKVNGVVLAEEFLIGPLVSVESITYKGETKILGITNRILGSLPYFVEVGYTFPIKLGDYLEGELADITYRLLESLEVDYGATHIEYILTNKGPVLVEINPRLGGGMLGPMISESFNDDIYLPLLDIALGREPRIPHAPVKASSTFVIYSSKEGVVEDINTSLAEQCPGVKKVVINVKKGEKVSPPKDFRGEIGYVWASGETADISFSYCQTAAGCVIAKIR